MTRVSGAAPGWYPDPGGAPYVRWWDGEAWSHHVASLVPVVPGGRSKLVAGLLGIFLGGFGVHRFYLGYTGLGLLQILVTFVTCGLGSLWGLVEGILILVGNIDRDADGRPLAP